MAKISYEEYKRNVYNKGKQTQNTNTSTTKPVSGTGKKPITYDEYIKIRNQKSSASSSSKQNTSPISGAQEWEEKSRTILSEIDDYYSSWRSDSKEKYTSYNDEIETLLASANKWRNAYAGNDEAVKAINEISNALSKAKGNVYSSNKHYAQWGSEEEYNAYNAAMDLEKRAHALTTDMGNYYSTWRGDYKTKASIYNKQIDDLLEAAGTWESENLGDKKSREAIESLKKTLADNKTYLKESGEYYSQWDSEDAYKTYLKDTKKLDELNSMSVKDLEPKLKDKSKVAYTTSDGQKITWQQLYDKKKKQEDADSLYNNLSSQPDFQKYVQQGASIKNPTVKEAENGIKFFGLDTRPDIGNPVTYSRENWDEIEQESFESGATLRGDIRHTFMDDKQVEIYNYYLAKFGKDRADEYFKSIEDDLTDAKWAKDVENSAKFAQDAPVLASVGSVATSLGSSLEHVYNVGKYALTGEMGKSHMAEITNAVRGSVQEEVDLKIGNWDAFDFVYSTAMSGADSLVAGAVPGGEIILGLSAAAQGTNDALERGLNNRQAFWNGLLNGAAEAIFEHASIGNFKRLKEVPSALGKDILKNIGKSMLVNASEEALTEITNIAYDTIFNGELAHYSIEDLKNGAWKQALGQVAEAGASGALMGFGFGNMGNAIGYAKGAAEAKNKYGSKPGALVTEALEVNPNNALAQRMQDRLNDNKKVTGGQLLRLEQQTDRTAVENDKAKIRQAAFDRLTELGATEDVELVANALTKQVAGEELTKEEHDLIYKNKYAPQVAEELDPAFQNLDRAQYDAEWVKSHDNRWVQQIGTERINAEYYNRLTEPAQIAPETQEVENDTVLDPSENVAEISEEAAESPVSIENNGEFLNEGTKNATRKERAVSVVSLENGEMHVKRENGETVNAKSYRAVGSDRVYETIRNMSSNVEEANTYVQAYAASPVSAETFEKGLRLAQMYGAKNFPIGELESTSAGKLPENIRTMAYDHAQQSVQAAEAFLTEIGMSSESIKSVFAESPMNGRVDLNDMANGIRVAFQYGVVGIDKAKAPAGSDGLKLTDAQWNIAYQDGRAYARKRTDTVQTQNQTRKISKVKADRNAKVVNGVKYHGVSVSKRAMNERQRAGIEIAELLASMGMDVHLHQSIMDLNGQYVFTDDAGVYRSDNGFYRKRDGSIHIDVNAGIDGEGLLAYTLSHELTHFVEDWSSEKFKLYADTLISELGKTEADVDADLNRMINRIRNNPQYSELTEQEKQDIAYSELIAEYSETMLADTDVLKRIAEKIKAKDKLLAQKIRNFFAGIVKKLREAYKDYKPNSRLAQEAAETIRNVDALAEAFADAVVDAADRFSKAEATKSTNSVKDVSLSSTKEKDSEGQIVRADVDRLRTIGRKSVFAFTSEDLNKAQKWANRYYFGYRGTTSPFFRAWFGDWREFDISPVTVCDIPVYPGLDKIKNTQTGPVTIKDTGWELKVYRNNFNNTKGHSGTKHLSEYGMANLKELLENAILLDTEVHEHHSNNAKSELDDPVVFNHKLYAIGKRFNAGSPSLYKITIAERFQDEKHPHDMRFHNLRYVTDVEEIVQIPKKEKEAVSLWARQDRNSQDVFPREDLTTSYNYTVADVFRFVKKYDVDLKTGKHNFQPQPTSKITNPNGTPKVMYHGSPAQFTVFDKKKAKSSGLYGRGFYFTDSETHAGTYGQKYSVYLNIRNPLESGKATVTRAQVKAYLEEVAENEDYSIENYGTYDVDTILRNVMGSASKIDAFKVIQDINATAIGDMVEAAELFNQVNGTEFDGIVVSTETVAFRPEQIKSATDNIGTFDKNNPDIRFSQRDPDGGYSNRSLLANALESAVQHELEAKRLAEYKAGIAEMSKQQKKLSELTEEWRSLMFAKGTRSAEAKARIEALREEIDKTAVRINNYDKKLLGMEAAAPLQKVLEREKAKALKKAKEKEKAALKDQRADFNERVKKQKLRSSVEKNAKSLMNMMSHPTKDAHVPHSMLEPLNEFLESIDFVSKQQSEGGEATIRDIAYTRALNGVRRAVEGQVSTMNGSDFAGEYALDINADFIKKIDKHIKEIEDATKKLDTGTNRVYAMNSAELKQLSEILRTINKAIRDIDKLHMQGAKARVSDLAADTKQELSRRKPVKTDDGGKAMWANYTPWHAFRRMGKSAQQIFKGLMQGQAKLAQNVNAVIEFTKKTYSAKEVKKWESDIHTVELSSGENVKLTTAQLMSFYCLSQREHALDHLTGGGIRVVTIEDGLKKIRQPNKFLLSLEDVSKINELLMKNERAFAVAKELQKYMSSVGSDLINEISMARWDYMAATEKNYFPIKTDETSRDVKDPGQDTTNLWALLNKSFTKGLTEGANNAIYVESIFDVFADHMSEASEYNAFALPLVDAMRWFNYRERNKLDGTQVEDSGVHDTIKTVLGSAAVDYFRNLMTDINSSQKAGRHENIAGQILSRSKISSVGYNLRVMIQQPTAILRASLILDPVSLLKGTARIRTKELVKEMQQYSGIALWKSMGYYDLNVSRSVKEQIKHDSSFIDKANNVGTWLPGKMDEVTWARIWAAAKAQVAKNQKLKGEALLKATAELFEEIVYQTQVADSVLTRSSLMRSKSQFMKEATSFMAEPTVSLNILLSAFQDYEDGHKTWDKVKRGVMIGFAGYAMSSIVNACITALADAWRDDDEYEEFHEKYLQALFGEESFFDGNLFAELNPLEKIVFVKDIFSVLKGYDVMPGYADLFKSGFDLVTNYQKFIEGRGTITLYGLIYNTLQVVGSVGGIGLSNIAREVVGVWNHTIGMMYPEMKLVRYDIERKNQIRNALEGGSLTDAEAMDLLVEEGVAENEDEAYFTVEKWRSEDPQHYSKYNDLFEAAKAGKSIDKALKVLTDHGVKEKDAISTLKSKIGEWYTGTEDVLKSINKQQTINMLKKYTDMKESEITAQVNKWTAVVVTGIKYEEIEEKFLSGEIKESRAIEMRVKYGGQTQKEAAAVVSKWKCEKDTGVPDGSLREEFVDGNITEKEAVNAMVKYGSIKQREAEETVTGWKAEKETGIAYGSIRESYLEGELTGTKAADMYMSYGGKSESEAEDAVAELEFEKEYGFKYSDHKQKYLDDEISESTLREALTEYGEKSTEEADDIVRAYDWMKQNPKYDLTESQAVAYTKPIENYGISAKDAGIDPDTFVDYKKRVGKCEGTDLNGDGKTDKDSVRNAKLTVIHSLPLTPQQKDALYFQSKLAKSRIYQAPWH